MSYARKRQILFSGYSTAPRIWAILETACGGRWVDGAQQAACAEVAERRECIPNPLPKQRIDAAAI